MRGLSITGSIEALERDWKRMRDHIAMTARAEYESDGCPASPVTKREAAELLTQLECHE